jgi:hypothetical protein
MESSLIPRGRAYLVDQLQRAGTSAPHSKGARLRLAQLQNVQSRVKLSFGLICLIIRVSEKQASLL